MDVCDRILPLSIRHLQQRSDVPSVLLLMAAIINTDALQRKPCTDAVIENLCIINQKP